MGLWREGCQGSATTGLYRIPDKCITKHSSEIGVAELLAAEPRERCPQLQTIACTVGSDGFLVNLYASLTKLQLRAAKYLAIAMAARTSTGTAPQESRILKIVAVGRSAPLWSGPVWLRNIQGILKEMLGAPGAGGFPLSRGGRGGGKWKGERVVHFLLAQKVRGCERTGREIVCPPLSLPLTAFYA